MSPATVRVRVDDLLKMYRSMVLIREAEQALVRLFAENKVPGFIHSSIGEEATSVGVCSALRPDDYLTSTHRGHGHVLAQGADRRPFSAELYGRGGGCCRGKGGSMHVTDLDLCILGANGIVGAGIPIAAGAALASKLRGEDRIAVAFFGDGATDIGVFHEALNLASLWQVPAVFVCQNNGYADFMAQSAHQKIERVSERAAAYSMPGVTVDGNDVEAVYEAATEAVARALGEAMEADGACSCWARTSRTAAPMGRPTGCSTGSVRSASGTRPSRRRHRRLFGRRCAGRYAPRGRDHAHGLHRLRDGPGRQPGRQAALHVGRQGWRAAGDPDRDRRLALGGRAALPVAGGLDHA